MVMARRLEPGERRREMQLANGESGDDCDDDGMVMRGYEWRMETEMIDDARCRSFVQCV